VIHKGSTIITLAGTFVLGGALAASSVGSTGATTCNASYSNRTFSGAVVVNRGDSCRLNNVVIDGGLTVTGGTIKVDNSVINRGWKITGGTGKAGPNAPLTDQCGNNINGGLSVIGADGNTASGWFVFGEEHRHCAGGAINGGVRFVHSHATLEVDNEIIDGGIVDTNNSGEFGEIEGVVVRGSAICAHNNFVHGGTTAINDEKDDFNTYIGENTGCPS
jgi:hypothetical protein